MARLSASSPRPAAPITDTSPRDCSRRISLRTRTSVWLSLTTRTRRRLIALLLFPRLVRASEPTCSILQKNAELSQLLYRFNTACQEFPETSHGFENGYLCRAPKNPRPDCSGRGPGRGTGEG